MQSPNFPNEVFRVVMTAGKPHEPPQVSVTAIPAKYNQATISTANRRRIAFDKLGKPEIVAESHCMLIMRTWVQSREHIMEVCMKMQSRMQGNVQKKLESLQKLQLGLIQEPIIREREYEDD